MSNQPNILFIMCDQMRFDALGCNGNKVIQTPNLDRLAVEGINFTNAFTPSPICVPARASLTTGCYAHKCIGTKENGGAIKEGYPLLGAELNVRGYETYVAGKLHYSPYRPPGQPRTTHGLKHVEFAESGRILKKYDPEGKLQGLEDYHDYLYTVGWGGYERGHGLGNNDIFPAPSPIPQQYYVDTWVADRSIDMISSHLTNCTNQPFFMWASFPKPHAAFDPPRPFDSMYDPRDIPEPIGDLQILKDRGLDEFVQKHYKNAWDFFSDAAKKVIKAYYYGLISHQDKQVGRLLDFLRENQLEENTIVVFTSDHGEMLGDFGMYAKRNFYNGSVRIPLMIRYPGHIEAATISNELIGLHDLMPTLLAMTGNPLQKKVDGIDLTPIWTSRQQNLRDYIIAQCHDHPNQQYMVASRNWKYIYHERGGIEELYHQIHDPEEKSNLADTADEEIQKIRSKMRNNLIEWCQNHQDTMMIGDGQLHQVDYTPNFEVPDRVLPFGRRFF